VAPAESTEPTTSWADIAAHGYRSPRDDGREREAAAGQHSAQAGQGDGRHVEDRNAIQADNMQEPDVPSEPSEEPERKKSVQSDVTSITKAPNREEKRGEEDPMECVEVMADDTNPARDMLPPPQENQDVKMKEWDEMQKERGWQALGSGEVNRDGTQQNEERTALPASSPKRRKKMRTKSNGEQTPVRECSRTRNVPTAKNKQNN